MPCRNKAELNSSGQNTCGPWHIFLSRIWNAQARLWHGYEVEGLENIPADGPAIIVHYHGAVPIDVYYLIAKCITDLGRLLSVVSDRSLFKIPGISYYVHIHFSLF